MHRHGIRRTQRLSLDSHDRGRARQRCHACLISGRRTAERCAWSTRPPSQPQSVRLRQHQTPVPHRGAHHGSQRALPPLDAHPDRAHHRQTAPPRPRVARGTTPVPSRRRRASHLPPPRPRLPQAHERNPDAFGGLNGLPSRRLVWLRRSLVLSQALGAGCCLALRTTIASTYLRVLTQRSSNGSTIL